MGQEAGLTRLTSDESLENIANPVKRSRAVARRSRKKLDDTLIKRLLMDYRHLDPLEAEDAAIKMAKKTMSNLAGLHNPDSVSYTHLTLPTILLV